MNEILRQRIGERVNSLKISWRRASLEAGLEAGFIQDLVTGRSTNPSTQALESLASVLQCSAAYLTGEGDEIDGEAEPAHQVLQPPQGIRQRPDAVMTLKIVDDLLAAGHVDAARMAVKRALKEIQADRTKQSVMGEMRQLAHA